MLSFLTKNPIFSIIFLWCCTWFSINEICVWTIKSYGCSARSVGKTFIFGRILFVVYIQHLIINHFVISTNFLHVHSAKLDVSNKAATLRTKISLSILWKTSIIVMVLPSSYQATLQTRSYLHHLLFFINVALNGIEGGELWTQIWIRR